MFNFNGFVESGALSGSSPTLFLINSSSGSERRLAELDRDKRKGVRRKAALIKYDSSWLPS